MKDKRKTIPARSEENLTPEQLHTRASFAGSLWKTGEITRTECFRLEMDAFLGRDSGPVKFEPNTEHQELVAEGWTPKRPLQPIED